MYYRDQYDNVVEYAPGMHTNSIHPGGLGYHPLTREGFDTNDVTNWFVKYKLWFLYALLLVLVIYFVRWLYQRRKPHEDFSMFY
jgi:hypothetical protein